MTLSPLSVTCPKLSMRRVVQRLSCLGATAVLAGCSVTANVYEARSTQLPTRGLQVTPGQTLEVFFNGLTPHSTVAQDLQAWQNTGLFTAVTQNTTDIPSPTGYFLRVACQYDNWENESGFIEGMLWLVTLGTFPALNQTSDYSCKLTMYENALQVASTTAYLQVRTAGNGWGVIPALFTKESRHASYAQTSANVRVRNTLAAMTKQAKK